MRTGVNPLIVGNWKMYKTRDESVAFVSALPDALPEDPPGVWIAPSFTSIHAAAEAAEGSSIVIGAQNMWFEDNGAFTGEISGRMLVDAGAQFVILGHSERRQLFHESNELVQAKVKKALAVGLKVIVCVGETDAEREQGKAFEVLETQIKACLAQIEPDESTIVLAYEPVWAIGTGKAATPEMAQEMHRHCREVLKKVWGGKISEKILILYGGSVKTDNAPFLLKQPDIDGLLIGGASLSLENFSKIINDSSILVSESKRMSGL
jgi:triosephosphate isomerase